MSKISDAIKRTTEALEKSQKVSKAIASVTQELTEAHRLAALKLAKKA